MNIAKKKTLPRRGIRLSKGGYYGYSPWSKLLITIFNVILSPLLIVCAIPLFFVIGLIIRLKEGGPILYAGVRLGLKKRPFTMYKFRTLPIDAQKKIGSELLSFRHGKLPFFSKFLRDTRLDELPQLFNIMKGEMDFIGPRPVRPEIYDRMCKSISNYDLRFNVRPGLVGYSQLFTPHSSPKRIRTLIDNRMIYLKRHIAGDILMILVTILAVLKKICQMLFSFFLNNIIRIKVLKAYNEKRGLDRIKQKNAEISIRPFPTANHDVKGQPCREEVKGVLVDINEEYFKMQTDKRLDKTTTYLYRLQKRIKKKGKVKRKVALCKGDIFKVVELNGDPYKYSYVIKYEPISQFNHYMVDQYFLNKSLMNFL